MLSLPGLYYRLAILNEVAEGKPLSQRTLAARLEVSLGQANKLLRGLENEGLIKVEAYGASRYALTDAGRRARMEAAVQIAVEARELFEPLRAEMAQSAARLRATGHRKALLCASEELADEAASALLNAGIKLAGVALLGDTERRTVAGAMVMDSPACRKAVFDVAIAATQQDADILRKLLGRRRSIELLLNSKEVAPRG